MEIMTYSYLRHLLTFAILFYHCELPYSTSLWRMGSSPGELSEELVT